MYVEKVHITCDRCGYETIGLPTANVPYGWAKIKASYGESSDWHPSQATYALCRSCRLTHYRWINGDAEPSRVGAAE